MSLSSALRGGEHKVKSFAQDRERSCHLTSNLFHNLFLTVWNESAFDENTLDHLESNYTLVSVCVTLASMSRKINHADG